MIIPEKDNIIIVTKGEILKVPMAPGGFLGFSVGGFVGSFKEWEDCTFKCIPLEVLSVNDPFINIRRVDSNNIDGKPTKILDLRKIEIQILTGDFIKSIQLDREKKKGR